MPFQCGAAVAAAARRQRRREAGGGGSEPAAAAVLQSSVRISRRSARRWAAVGSARRSKGAAVTHSSAAAAATDPPPADSDISWRDVPLGCRGPRDGHDGGGSCRGRCHAGGRELAGMIRRHCRRRDPGPAVYDSGATRRSESASAGPRRSGHGGFLLRFPEPMRAFNFQVPAVISSYFLSHPGLPGRSPPPCRGGGGEAHTYWQPRSAGRRLGPSGEMAARCPHAPSPGRIRVVEPCALETDTVS